MNKGSEEKDKCVCVGCGREIESDGIPLCSQCKTSKTFDHF